MKESKTEKVLQTLLDGNSITSMEAFQKYNLTRLSAVIFVLKKRGYQIETEMKYNKGTAYAEYRIKEGCEN